MSVSGLPPVGDMALEWNIVSLRARLRPLLSRVDEAALSEELDSEKGGLILVRGDMLVALVGLLDELLLLLLLLLLAPAEKNTVCPKLKEWLRS